jgi:hypothetical protein
MVELNVNGRTALPALERFAEPAGPDEIRGRRNDDGSITLYASESGKGTGFKDFFGMLDGRRAAAREAIDMVLTRAGERTGPSHAAPLDLTEPRVKLLER